MSGPVHVTITLGGRSGRARVKYFATSPGQHSHAGADIIDGAGSLPLGPNESVEEIHATPLIDGYWTGCVQVNGATQLHIDCRPMVASGPVDWWANVHGIVTPDATRASGIRIGVIDHSLGDQGWITSIANLVSTHSIVAG